MPALGVHPRRSRHNHVSAGSMLAISPEQLRAFVATDLENDENTDDTNLASKHRVLLLDCRSFVAYNGGHIADSVNAHCPAILRRRCGGKLPLRTIIPNASLRAALANNRCFPVVLYDDFGQNVKNLSELSGDESTAAFVAKCLRNEADLSTIYYLEGGYQSFCRLFPGLVRLPASPSLSASSQRSPSPSCGGPVEILPHLLLGSARDAGRREALQSLGVTALLNVTRVLPNLFADAFQYLCIPVRDAGCEDIAAHFHDAIRFIDAVKASGGRVLVHCQAGISRSATICIAYLMATKRLRMEEAYQHVKARRRIVSPNFSFMGQLLTFEGQIFSAAPSARGPLKGLDAISPDPDALTPARAAQQSVFDFAPSADFDFANEAPSVGDFSGGATPLEENCHKLTLSPCVT